MVMISESDIIRFLRRWGDSFVDVTDFLAIGKPKNFVFCFALCSRLRNFGQAEVRRRFGKIETSLLFRSPCTNFA